MKIKSNILPILAMLACGMPAVSAHAHDNHSFARDAGEKIKAPNGGRVLTRVEPHAEFLLTADRRVQITFVDDDGRIVAPADQVVTVFTGERLSPTRLSFKKSGNTLISDGVVPAGDGFATVVQIKSSPDGATVTEKFNLVLSTCGECSLKEYACVCDH